jgi:hypothetical protein
VTTFPVGNAGDRPVMPYAKFCDLLEWIAKGYLLGRYNQQQFCEEVSTLADIYAAKGDPDEIPVPPTNALVEALGRMGNNKPQPQRQQNSAEQALFEAQQAATE